MPNSFFYIYIKVDSTENLGSIKQAYGLLCLLNARIFLIDCKGAKGVSYHT